MKTYFQPIDHERQVVARLDMKYCGVLGANGGLPNGMTYPTVSQVTFYTWDNVIYNKKVFDMFQE